MSSTIKSYFERKKRDISDKSNNEDKREKAEQLGFIVKQRTEQLGKVSESINFLN